MSSQNQERHDPYAALRNQDFRLLLAGRFITAFGNEMLSFAISWELWLRTHQAFVLGMLGVAQLPPMKNAGRTLLLSVTGFGLGTIVFSLSTSFILSLAMLTTLGALDNISVVIRGTLLLTQTPDAMRGRISAVNSIFIGISNEL